MRILLWGLKSSTDHLNSLYFYELNDGLQSSPTTAKSPILTKVYVELPQALTIFG